jgi:hypothetical protein
VPRCLPGSSGDPWWATDLCLLSYLKNTTAITYTPSSDRLDARDVFEALSVTHKGIFNMERYVKPCQAMSSHCVQIADSLALVQIVEVNVDSFPKVIWA